MKSLTLVLIFISVSLSALAQIALKHGMSNKVVQAALKSSLASGAVSILTNLSVLAGLSSYVLSALLWLLVLSKTDVSKAYPFVGLGFIGTMILAYLFLDEPLSVAKLIGTSLIVLGIVLITKA